MTKEIQTVMIFGNMNLCAFDEQGNQIPEIQRNLVSLWAEHAEKNGYNVHGVVVETFSGKWKIFRTSDGGFNIEAV